MTIRPQELITLGIFSVMIIVINMVINMLAVFSPFLIPLTKSLSGLVAGIPFMLYLTRVKQGGLIGLMALVLAVIMVLAGDYILTLASALVAGAIADVICRAARKNHSRVLTILGYSVFNLWSVGGILPLLFMREEMEAQVAQQLGAEYAHSFTQLFSVSVVCWTLVGIFVSGLLGAVIGLVMLNKHFVKAGLAQKNG
ncbi:Trep_Strep domain-containing protein [Buttiauxella warmboldiae]|uniref:Trep_Strep domain-containing protein n=1 Tax=Buttiauxella warmboldiae TaxID=82993 RepID=A0A3N5DR67_9ENTR|nr:MptD family putative ECF transporter S component [Buttiauxella warmboldiae]RPH24129.1 Trep_Strep domain-containing protein [Buttiauxella warmboldiae]